MIFKPMRQILGAVVDLIYPRVCAACYNEIHGEAVLCSACLESIQSIPPPICETCGAPVKENLPSPRCPECPPLPIPFTAARSVLDYADDRVRNLIHALKYEYQTRLSEILGNMLLQGYQHYFGEILMDAIVPIPLHKKKLRKREFNQSTLICRSLSQAAGIPIREDWVKRIRNTPAQANLPNQKRRENLRGAFAPTKTCSAKGLSVLVVDDVYTTGSTVYEVCTVLKNVGAKQIYVLTLARSI